MHNVYSSALLVLMVVAGAPLVVGPAQAQMTVPGSFAVSEGGAAAYEIPIDVPPGTAGVEPKLSLTYSSSGGDTFFGYGWSLSGLSSITRCPQTLARDGQIRGMKFNATDKYCLDGERLIAVSGVYGADGTEYRTEADGFSRIKSFSSTGGGPLYFRVWTKAGLVMDYGGTFGSRIEAWGSAHARVWALDKVVDTTGNFMNITYNEDNANGTYGPSRIDYTGNGASAPFASVQFVYGARTQRFDSRWLSGAASNHTQLVHEIEVYEGTTLVREYKLNFSHGSVTARDLLDSIELCEGNSGGAACLPARPTFQYSGAPLNDFTIVSNLQGKDGSLVGYQPIIGDYNGDGRADILWNGTATDGRSTATRELWTSNGDGTFQVDTAVGGIGSAYGAWRVNTGDFDGDGLTDLWWWGDSSGTNTSDGVRNIQYSDGVDSSGAISFTTDANPQNANGQYGGWNFEFFDMNADGRTDVFWDLRHVPGGTSQGYHFAWLVNGRLANVTGVANPAGTAGGQYSGWQMAPAQISADGHSDVLWFDTLGYRDVWFGNGNGNYSKAYNYGNSSGAYLNHLPLLGDFNGDGNTDIIWNSSDTYGRSTGTRDMWLSRGNGIVTGAANVAGQNGAWTNSAFLTGDFDGDGATDIFIDTQDTVGRSTGTRAIWLARGNVSFAGITNIAGQDGSYVGWAPVLADFNGDGKTDILWFTADDYGRTSSLRTLWLSNPEPEDLLVSVSNGLGSTSHIEYASLSQKDAPYEKDSGVNAASYPVMDLEAPMYVVSELRADDGIGGVTTTRYRYGGLKYDHERRQALGFRWREVEQVETGVKKYTEYRQDFPYIGRTSLIETRLLDTAQGDNGLVRQSTNTYQCKDFVGAAGCQVQVGSRYFVYQDGSVEKGWDLDGTALPETTTTSEYDDYGNATRVDVSVFDPATSETFAKTTTNTFQNPGYDAGNDTWILGRLTRAQVASTTP